jgi:DNA-binding transcriptional regulator YiaG
MKYSHRSNYRKTCPHDPDTRIQLGSRLRYARIKLGWSVEDAGKYFQVTDRTWHNWETGAHRIPFAVYKLARVLASLELPGAAWAGWRIEGDQLITPENRIITPKDGSWWSLLIRQAASFRTAYAEANRLRLELSQFAVNNSVARPATEQSGAAALSGVVAAGLVPSKTSGNELTSGRRLNDVIMTSWPIPSDSQTPLTLLHAPRPTTSASALTPSFVLPWTPTCEARVNLLRPEQMHQRRHQHYLQQVYLARKLALSQSSVEPKSRRSMSATRPNANAISDTSARPAAAKAAKLASAPKPSGGAL